MNWLISLSVILLTGFLGLVCGGFVGDACVRWFRISSFEGGSGYFVVFLALLGGIVGLVVGGIATTVVLKSPYPSFLAALLWSWGTMLALSGLVGAVSWMAADIAPRLGGDELTLEVEVRLASGASAPAEWEGDSLLALHSASGQTVRKSETGRMLPEKARREGERWIVPGEVFLFTGRGQRSLEFRFGGESVPGFLLPLPAKPGEEHLEWSEWMPRDPWPETSPSCRFRVQRILPPPPPDLPRPAEEVWAEQEREELALVETVDLDAPMEEWLTYLGPPAKEAVRTRAVERVRSRSGFRDELSEMFVSDDAKRAAAALGLVNRLDPDTGLVDDVVAAGVDLAERIRVVNATTVEDDPGYNGAAAISLRFSAWMSAARALRKSADGDFTPELQTILELSRERTDSIVMQDVCRVASFYLHEWAGIPPLPTDPAPR